MKVAIVALGDLGRSPRMLCHALACADTLADVDLIGYAGSPLCRRLKEHPRIRAHFLPSTRTHLYLPRAVFMAVSATRALRQSLQLLWFLGWRIAKPDFLLVQNPPAVPTLLVTFLVARLRSARWVVDWHNFGYSMLALRLGTHHVVVKLAAWYERFLGARADAHLCVSKAMARELRDRWQIDATVLYDLPREEFRPAPRHVRQDLLRRLSDVLSFDPTACSPDRSDGPALIVSPTSWTADEDYELLLEAVLRCEEMIQAAQRQEQEREFPPLLVLVTGAGPLQSKYEQQIAGLATRKVHLRTVWLSPEDYPLMLGSADLGICLHRSSSGVDLPMKVADMLGSGLPVCAFDYGPCLRERLRQGENALFFSSSTELATQLYDLFKGFPSETPLLDRLRQKIAASSGPRWTDEWREQAFPLFHL